MAFDGNHVWVACPTRLHKIDTRVGAIVLTVTFPKASLRGLCFDGARLWLSGSNGGWGCIWTIDVNWGFSIAAVPPLSHPLK